MVLPPDLKIPLDVHALAVWPGLCIEVRDKGRRWCADDGAVDCAENDARNRSVHPATKQTLKGNLPFTCDDPLRARRQILFGVVRGFGASKNHAPSGSAGSGSNLQYVPPRH